MATYYVVARTLWQGDKFSPIAGGFKSRKEAQQVADQEADNGVNEYGQQDLTRVVNTMVVSKTRLHREFGFEEWQAIERIAEIAKHNAWLVEMALMQVSDEIFE